MKHHNLVDVILERVKNSPDKTALIFLNDSGNEIDKITYKELDEVAKSIAVKLLKKLKKGDRVLLLFPPGLDFVKAYFGCLYAGIIAVPTYPPDPSRLKKTLPRLKTIIKDSQSHAILTNNLILKVSPLIFLLSPELMKLKWISVDRINSDLKNEWKYPDINLDSIAFLQYTSGSTSLPKGVMVTHKNLLINSEIIYKLANHNENSVYVCWVPNYHDMGLIGGIIQPIYGNFLGVLMSPISFLKKPSVWLKAIDKYRGTTSPFPNFALDLCIRKISDDEIKNIDLSCWKLACNGAEPIKKDSLDKFNEKFKAYGYDEKAMYPAYGLAESTLIVSGNNFQEKYYYLNLNKKELEKNNVSILNEETENTVTIVSCGRPVENHKVLIINTENLDQCQENEIGEIWISGDCIAKGYWNKDDETQKIFHAKVNNLEDKFLRTGDLGFVNNNQLYITGRLKDLIIIRGYNHYPQDIEQSVQSLENLYPSIKPGGTVATSTEVKGIEQLLIFQEIDKNRENDISNFSFDKIITSIREKIFENHDINAYGVVLIKSGTLPKTSSGKIMRHACKEAFLNDFRSSSMKILEKSFIEVINYNVSESEKEYNMNLDKNNFTNIELQNWMINWFSTEMDTERENIDINISFSEFALDSVKAMDFVTDLEALLDIEIDEMVLFQYKNIKLLSEYLYKKKEI